MGSFLRMMVSRLNPVPVWRSHTNPCLGYPSLWSSSLPNSRGKYRDRCPAIDMRCMGQVNTNVVQHRGFLNKPGIHRQLGCLSTIDRALLVTSVVCDIYIVQLGTLFVVFIDNCLYVHKIEPKIARSYLMQNNIKMPNLEKQAFKTSSNSMHRIKN